MADETGGLERGLSRALLRRLEDEVLRETGNRYERLVREIDAALLPILRRLIQRGDLTRAAAEALHRHLRWAQFARRFAPGVHYRAEER